MEGLSPRASQRIPLAPVSENALNGSSSNHRSSGAGKPPSSSSTAAKRTPQTDPASNSSRTDILSPVASKKAAISKVAKEHTRSNNAVSVVGSTLKGPHTRIYSVTFPPGNMGLDLEPLIVSLAPERLIGCKVKGFYFALDHSGISDEELMRSVSVGDIIARVNDKDVLFSQFEDILNELRLLKRETRTVYFKTISYDDDDAKTSTTLSLLTPSQASREASPNSSPAATSKRESPSFSTPTKASSTRRIDVSLLSPAQEVSSVSLNSCSPKRESRQHVGVINGGDSCSSSPLKRSQSISPRAADSVAVTSPAQTESRPAVFSPSSVKQMMRAKFESMSVIDVDSSVADGVGNAPRVDVSSDSLSIGSLHSSVEAAESAAPAQTRPLAISMSSMPRRRFVGSNLGSKIVQVGSVLGHSVLAAATVVSQSAERIMDTAIPMYSEEQMDDIMNKKDTLLRELSQTCMMLGVSEQKQRDLEDQLNMLRHTEERAEDSRRLAEERYRLACSRFEEASLELAAVQADRDAWSARAHAAETEMEDMRAKVRSCKDTIASLKSELESSKSLLHSTTIEKAKIESSLLETERNNRDMHLIVAEIKADLESERSAHIADTSSWNMQFDRMDEEQQKLREELKLALDEAASRFKAIEGQRDDALKECDILKELMETYRVAHDAEMSRMKENVNAQQQWQKERLKERDDEINRLRRELEILNSRSNELSEQLAVRSTENTDLSQRLLRAEAETAVVTHAARSLESKLTELAEEKQGIEASMKSSISEKNTEIVRLRDEVFKAQSATLSASENADRLKSNLFEVESALRAAEEKNHSLHEKLRHARAEGEESNENWKQVISLLRVQMEERETELRNAMQCVQESARIQAEELRASVNELSMQLADNKQSEERLQDELLSYKQFFESVLREIKVDVQMSNDFDFVIGLISAKVSAVVESQLILAEKESNIAESNKKIVSLMSELGQVNSELMTAKLKTATLNRDHSVTVNSLMEEVGRLNAELVGHRTAETELRADLDKCKLELHSVTNQYTSTKNEYESIQILIRNKTNELELIRRNYAEEIELLNARVNSRELSNNEMICQLEAKERLIFELQQSNEGLSQNVAQATKDLASSESAVAKAMEELQQTAVKLQYSCNENQKLRDACDEKVRSLELKIGEMARLTLANDALQLQLDQFKSSLKLAESEVVSLKSSLQGKDSAIEKLRAEIKSLEEKEAFLSSQLEAASESQREEKHLHERSIATLTRSIDILTAKLNASERNNKRLKDDIASLSEQYNSSISAAAELELKLIESSNKTMANPSESSLISDKFKKFVEKIAKLEEVLSQEQERNFKLSSDLSETNFEVMRLQESIAENQSSFALQIDDANNKISALRKTTESMESELNGKSEDLAVASANISKLQDVINKKDESIDLLNKSHSAAVAKYRHVFNKIKLRYRDEIFFARSEMAEVKDCVASIFKEAKLQSSKDISAAFALFSTKLADSQSRIASLQASIAQVQGQAVTSEKLSQERIETYDGAVEQLERDVSELNIQLAKSNQKVQELERQIKESSGAAQQLASAAEKKRQALVEEYETVIEGLRSDRAALVRKMETLCEKISGYQDQIAELLVDRDRLAQQCAKMEEKAEGIAHRVNDLEAENRKLRDQVQFFESKSTEFSEAEALESLRKDRAMMYAALEEAGQENIALREKLFENSKDVRKLHSLLEKADARLAIIEKEREVEQTKFEQRIKEFNEREGSIRLTLEETMESYRVERASLITSYETQLSNHSDNIVTKYQDIVDKLRKDLESFELLREQWISKERDYVTSIERLTLQLNQAKDELKEKSEVSKESSVNEHKLNVLQTELAESQQKCSASLVEIQKLRKDHDIVLKELRVNTETVANLRISLGNMERSLKDTQSREAILRLRLTESESKVKEMECLREDVAHTDEESRVRIEELLEENSAFAACIEEFETKFVSMNSMLKDGQRKNTALIDECSRLEALVHSKDEELENALLRYQTLAANFGLGNSDSSTSMHEKIVELTGKCIKMQFDYKQVCAQLLEKDNEIKTLRSVSITMNESVCAGDNLVLQSRWRDELWTQGLELQSAVTDLTNILRSAESGLRPTKAVNVNDPDCCNSSVNESQAVANYKPRLSTRLRVKIESKKQLMHSELAGVNQVLSEIMDRLHIFQTTLLTPPWEDKTVEQATEELIKGKLVKLKRVESQREQGLHGLKCQATVFKAVIKMLLRVMRKKIATKFSESPAPARFASTNANRTVIEDDVPLDYSMDCGAQDDIVNYSRSSVWDISSDEEADDACDQHEDPWNRNPILGFN